jgi:hypothetical protein
MAVPSRFSKSLFADACCAELCCWVAVGGGLSWRLDFLFCRDDLRERLRKFRVTCGLSLVGVGDCFLLRGSCGLQAGGGGAIGI